MAVISKGMVVASALIALGIVTVDDIAKGLFQPATALAQAQEATPDARVIEHGVLRERAAAALRELTDKQDAGRATTEPVAQPNCRNQAWPYYSHDCLVRSDGAEPLPVIRVVQFERRTEAHVLPARVH